jgi:hypothetical protein
LAYCRLVIAVELFQPHEIEGPDPARLGGAGDLTPHRHVANCTGLQPQNRGRVSDFYPVSRWEVLMTPAGHTAADPANSAARVAGSKMAQYCNGVQVKLRINSDLPNNAWCRPDAKKQTTSGSLRA